jgi:hypothetical protein
MVGAGLALTQVGGGMRSGRLHERSGLSGRDEYGEQLTDTVKRTMQDASSKISDTVENLKEKAASAAGEAKSAVCRALNALPRLRYQRQRLIA